MTLSNRDLFKLAMTECQQHSHAFVGYQYTEIWLFLANFMNYQSIADLSSINDFIGCYWVLLHQEWKYRIPYITLKNSPRDIENHPSSVQINHRNSTKYPIQKYIISLHYFFWSSRCCNIKTKWNKIHCDYTCMANIVRFKILDRDNSNPHIHVHTMNFNTQPAILSSR